MALGNDETSWCKSHHRDEAWTFNTFQICEFCGHVFLTKRELIEATNRQAQAGVVTLEDHVEHCPFCLHLLCEVA